MQRNKAELQANAARKAIIMPNNAARLKEFATFNTADMKILTYRRPAGYCGDDVEEASCGDDADNRQET